MEFLIGIGTWIAQKTAEYTVAPVGRQLGYVFLYRRNLGNLKTKIQELNLKKKTMEDLANDAKRQGDEIHDDIRDCLIRVGKITKDSEMLLSNTELKCSFMGPFSFLVWRYQLSKKAKEMGDSVVEIKGKIRLDNISYRPKIRSNFENKDYLTSATREKFVDGIMEVLGDGDIRTIGVHGMPGAGKTMLVNEIARKALEKDQSLFDDAVIVTVSQTPNLENIQQRIADRLDLKFNKKMIPERALELKKRLKDEKKFLIILDDVWNKLNLEDVGTVFESEQKGCKILLTSRFERVLGNDMSVDRNFKVELLSEDEATNWFNDIVGDVVETRGFKKLGNKIAKKCGRLPLVIVTVAHTLKNCDKLPLWKDTWRQLQRSKHSEVVHSAIKLCYDMLQGDEAKRLFLLCALHEEDASIEMEYLMRFGVGQMDMFRDVYTLQEARDLVHHLVDQLKDRCLLLDGDGFQTVRMHDVIRDIAISIGKECHNMHCFRDGCEVVEFTKDKKFEDLKAISLPNGYLNELPCERSEYKHLQLILCTWRERPSQTIPHQFFEKAKQLRVFAFSNTAFAFVGCPKVSASSLLPLQNLCTLCLRNSDVEDIAFIGELKNLEILDLSNTKTKQLPSQIGQLTHLRMLDLSGCSRLEVIEPDVILNLEQLEELYMEYFENWHEVEAVNVERKNASVDELKYLVRLTALDLHVPNLKMLPQVLPSKKLKRFKIRIGVNVIVYDYDYDILESSISRYLRIKHSESSVLRKHSLEMLVERSEVLFLDGLNGVNNIVNELDAEGFPELKLLRLENNDTIQYLVSLTGQQIQPRTVFGSLHTLFLVNLQNLKEICNGEVTSESFKSLRVVKVRSCKRMKKLLPFSTTTQLEKIKVFYCEEMEEIFTHHKEDHDGDNKEVIAEFPQLRSLKLRNTSKLREFCSKTFNKISSFQIKEDGPFVADSIRPMFNRKFLCFPKLENLRLSGCHMKKIWDDQLLPSSTTSFRRLTKLVVVKCKFLKYVFSSATAASFEQLRSLVVRDCVTMQELMSRDEKINYNISFPNLDSLELQNLPNVVTFSCDIFIELPMLTHLSIKDCPEFETFVSKSSQPKFCTIITSLFNEKVALPSLKSVKIDGMDRLKMIWQNNLCTNADSFCKLEEVEIENCKNLKKIFPCSIDRRLPNLRSLEISDCEMVEEIFEIQTSNSEEICDTISTQWKHLGLHRLPNLKYVWSKYPQGTFIFPNLEEVEAFQCPNLKAIFPPSVAKGLSGLKKLNIKKCGIEEIVVKEEGLGTVPSEFVFPQLQIMQLISLPNLVSFCAGPNISRFPSLEKLQVKECMKVKVLFSLELLSFQSTHGSVDGDIRPIQQTLFFIDKFLCFPKLEKLELSGCHMKKIWDHDQLLPRSTCFRLIKKLVVVKCQFLKYVFSSSATATSFEQLVSLEVRDCETMEEIMSRDKKMDNISFPNLKSLDLKNLPNMETFSYNIISIMFPMLTHLSIKNCPEFKSFVSKSPQEKSCTTIPSLFNEKVAFPILKSVNIDGLDRLKMIWQNELCSNAYSFCELEEVKVENCKNLVKIIPCVMYKRLPNLTSLEISNCEMVREIFEIETSNCEEIYDIISTQLKYLVLHHLPNLKYVWSKNPQGTFAYSPNVKEVEKCGIKEIVGQEEALKTEAPDFVLFPQFEKMVLKSLPNLVSFYAGPHTLGFPFLKWLEVENCLKVKVFFTSQFLSTQGTHGLGHHDHIPIQQPALFFVDKFLCYPNLENLRLSGCFMKKIWDDQLLPNIPTSSFSLLKKLVVVKCHFLKYVFSYAMAASFEQLGSLEVRDCETMQEIISRDERMDSISFAKLDSLDLKNLPNVVTFSFEIFIKFPVLTHLSIENCPEFKTFVSKSLQGKSTPSLFNEKVAFPCLKSVKIDGMETLKMIWQSKLYNEDSFCKLEEVEIENCKNLRKIFPYGIHRRLSNLTSLEISDCENVEEIFEIQTSNSEEICDTISTQLKYLGLHRLPNLKYVWSKYPQGTFVFPNLEEVEAFQCPNLKAIFPPSVAKGLSQLKRLNIQKCGIQEIVGKEEGLGTVPPEFVFPQLQIMQLISLPNLVSFCAGPNTSRFPLLENLQVKECMKVKVLFASEILSFQSTHGSGYGDIGPIEQPLHFKYKVTFGSSLHQDLAGEDRKCAGTLPHLRKLKLCQLPNLLHLGEESSQQPQTLAFQDSTYLQVSRCGRLNNLELSSIIRFQNLRDLRVSKCHGMLHLLSSQTAKSLTHLIVMKISKCKRMAEIIADSTEGNTEGGEIVFNGLRYLELDSLPSLSCFYSGNYTMGFPNLKGVIVSRCLEMQTFSKHGIIVVPKLKDIYINEIIEESNSESESESEADSDSDSESESFSIEITKDINTTISDHWMNRDGSALQKLFNETDLEP